MYEGFGGESIPCRLDRLEKEAIRTSDYIDLIVDAIGTIHGSDGCGGLSHYHKSHLKNCLTLLVDQIKRDIRYEHED